MPCLKVCCKTSFTKEVLASIESTANRQIAESQTHPDIGHEAPKQAHIANINLSAVLDPQKNPRNLKNESVLCKGLFKQNTMILNHSRSILSILQIMRDLN